jgi:hypothetical protein
MLVSVSCKFVYACELSLRGCMCLLTRAYIYISNVFCLCLCIVCELIFVWVGCVYVCDF